MNRAFLRFVAAVLFAIAAILLFAGIWTVESDLGLVAAGLACWACA